jgi:hypothetical protein
LISTKTIWLTSNAIQISLLVEIFLIDSLAVFSKINNTQKLKVKLKPSATFNTGEGHS